jgi:hypothetical protein
MSALWANFISGVFIGFALAVAVGIIMQAVALRRGK